MNRVARAFKSFADKEEQECWSLGAGLDLSFSHQLLKAELKGQIFVEYARFSKRRVQQTTSALLGGTTQTRVTGQASPRTDETRN